MSYSVTGLDILAAGLAKNNVDTIDGLRQEITELRIKLAESQAEKDRLIGIIIKAGLDIFPEKSV
jgi:hypothetical protein